MARQGGIISQEAALHLSKVQIVCDRCGPTRVGFRFLENGTKERFCRKCETALPERQLQT